LSVCANDNETQNKAIDDTNNFLINEPIIYGRKDNRKLIFRWEIFEFIIVNFFSDKIRLIFRHKTTTIVLKTIS